MDMVSGIAGDTVDYSGIPVNDVNKRFCKSWLKLQMVLVFINGITKCYWYYINWFKILLEVLEMIQSSGDELNNTLRGGAGNDTLRWWSW